jgi:hypothetical protein
VEFKPGSYHLMLRQQRRGQDVSSRSLAHLLIDEIVGRECRLGGARSRFCRRQAGDPC